MRAVRIILWSVVLLTLIGIGVAKMLLPKPFAKAPTAAALSDGDPHADRSGREELLDRQPSRPRLGGGFHFHELPGLLPDHVASDG